MDTIMPVFHSAASFTSRAFLAFCIACLGGCQKKNESQPQPGSHQAPITPKAEFPSLQTEPRSESGTDTAGSAGTSKDRAQAPSFVFATSAQSPSRTTLAVPAGPKWRRRTKRIRIRASVLDPSRRFLHESGKGDDFLAAVPRRPVYSSGRSGGANRRRRGRPAHPAILHRDRGKGADPGLGTASRPGGQRRYRNLRFARQRLSRLGGGPYHRAFRLSGGWRLGYGSPSLGRQSSASARLRKRGPFHAQGGSALSGVWKPDPPRRPLP